MFKSVLGVALSLLFGIVVQSNAYAAHTAHGHAKKHSAKKTLAVKKHHRAKTTLAHSGGVSHDRVATRVSFHHHHHGGYQRVSYVPSSHSAGDLAGLNATHDALALQSNVALVVDPATSQVLFEKNSSVALPIASITKLMTALVVVEANQDMNEVLEVTDADVDHEKNTSSRLRIGARMTRANMLHIALMSSENRAASALGRNYPGGISAFVAAMNAKAKELGMNDTHYVDSTGLNSHNVASARDLAKLITVAQQHPILCQYSTDQQYVVDTGRNQLQYRNSNHLVNNPAWEIMLQKTGYIVEAGRCLVMQAKIEGRAVVMVLLDSKTKESRLADADRVRRWLESQKFNTLTSASAAQS